VALLFAIPGSGKSRTVEQAAKKHDYRRFKFRDDHTERFLSLIEQEKHDYDGWKRIFSELAKEILTPLLEPAKDGGLVVLHIDDAQTLMSDKVVTRNDWDAQTGNPWDLVMPSVCSRLSSLADHHDKFRVVISGTNFFGPLMFNGGSQMKAREVTIDGMFSTDFVNALIDKYFKFDRDVREKVRHDVEFIRANRRATEHYLRLLYQCVSDKRSGDVVTVDEIAGCRNRAERAWSEPIVKSLGRATETAVRTLAVLMFPDTYGGKSSDEGELVFPLDRFPHEVLRFALAGGLNIQMRTEDVRVRRPSGCVWQFLLSRCCLALQSDNALDLSAFVQVSKSVPIDVGHALERSLACELTMLSDSCRLYSAFTTQLAKIADYQPDPMCFARSFVYQPIIAEAPWPDHTVLCVVEDPKASGRRLVDIGFPLLRRVQTDSSAAPPMLRVMCEVKSGYENELSKLWKLCFKFFDKMKPIVEQDASVVACFVAEARFTNHKPQKKKSTGVNAHASKINVQKLMRSSLRYLIVEDICSFAVLPLRQMIAGDKVIELQTLTSEFTTLYLGSPNKNKISFDEKSSDDD
jgi:hypothetical protein